MVKCNRPWHPPPLYGRYGAARPATKHATINLYHMRWGCVVKTRKNINYYYKFDYYCASRQRRCATTSYRWWNDGRHSVAPPPPSNHTTINWHAMRQVCIIKTRRKYYLFLWKLIFMLARRRWRSTMQHATSITSPSRHPLLCNASLLASLTPSRPLWQSHTRVHRVATCCRVASCVQLITDHPRCSDSTPAH